MSLGDLTNDTARDATDFATEMAVDTVGANGDITRSGTIVPRWTDPPGGVRKAGFRQKCESDLSHGKFSPDGVISRLCVWLKKEMAGVLLPAVSFKKRFYPIRFFQISIYFYGFY